ncbi:MAG: hypothetical protein WCE69_05840, partial [Aestuariivirga sp.]
METGSNSFKMVMTKCWLIIVISVLFQASSNCLFAQSNVHINLPPTKRAPALKFFTFKKISVIDNRADTTYIYIQRNIGSDPRKVNFEQPFKAVVKDYLDNALKKVPLGSRELVLRFEQFSVPNIYFKNLYTKDSIIVRSKIREYLFVKVSAYEKAGETTFKKLMTLSGVQHYHHVKHLPRMLSVLLNDLLIGLTIPQVNNGYFSKSQNRLIKSGVLTFYNDNQIQRIEQIDKPVYFDWAEYPVFKNPIFSKGVFKTFEDFRNNRITPLPDTFLIKSKDSIYT